MNSPSERSVATRLLDQCALDDLVLVALCEADSQLAAELAEFKRQPALRRIVRNMPFVGPLARSIYRRVVRDRRFER